MSLAHRIVSRRKHLGLSQAELARRLGTTRGTVWGWESGRNRPDHANFQKLARTLKTSRAYLLGETDEPDPGVAEPVSQWGRAESEPADDYIRAARDRERLLAEAPLPGEHSPDSLLHRLLVHDLSARRVVRLDSFRAAVLEVAHGLRMGLGPEEAYSKLVRVADDIAWWSQLLGGNIRVRVDLELPDET